MIYAVTCPARTSPPACDDNGATCSMDSLDQSASQ